MLITPDFNKTTSIFPSLPSLAMIEELFEKLNPENSRDWGMVLLGVSGLPSMNEYLPATAVMKFAAGDLALMSIDDPNLDLVADLAMNTSPDSKEIRDKVEIICQHKKIDLNKSKRKWRFILIQNILANLDLDPVHGLIKIAEFWAAWNWPEDAPSSMQLSNKVSAEIYHSLIHYQSVIQNHREWLTEERKILH